MSAAISNGSGCCIPNGSPRAGRERPLSQATVIDEAHWTLKNPLRQTDEPWSWRKPPRVLKPHGAADTRADWMELTMDGREGFVEG